jgi:hypothetical protein
MKRLHLLFFAVLMGLMSLSAQAQRSDDLDLGQRPTVGQERQARQGRGGRAPDRAALREIRQATRDGDIQRAKTLLDDLLQRQPDNAQAHFMKAQMAVRDKDAATARSELATAEKLAPGLPFAREEQVTALRTRVDRISAREARADLPRARRNAPQGDPAAPMETPADNRGAQPPTDRSASTNSGSGGRVESRPAGEDTRNMGAPPTSAPAPEREASAGKGSLLTGVLIGAVIAAALMALFLRRRARPN